MMLRRACWLFAIAVSAGGCTPAAYNKDGVPVEALIYKIGHGKGGDGSVISQIYRITSVPDNRLVYEKKNTTGWAGLINAPLAINIAESVPPGTYRIEYGCRYEARGVAGDAPLGQGQQTLTVQAGEAWKLVNDASYYYTPSYSGPNLTGVDCEPHFVKVPYPKD